MNKMIGAPMRITDMDGDPMPTLMAELEACRDAVKYCFDLAMQTEPIPEGRKPRPPWSQMRDIGDRFSAMNMAIELMEASGKLAESMAKAKSGGELRQSITVERLERFAGDGLPPAQPRAKTVRQNKDAVPALAAQGEGGGGE